MTTSVVDPAWGLPVKVTDANGKVTEASYDALGRLTGVWLPGRAKGSVTPHLEYSYLVRTTGPNAVTTKSLVHDGSYATSTELFDGLLRARQTQATSANGAGRLITDVIHDSRGLVERENHPWFANGTPSTSLVIPSSAVPARTRYVYDGVGRVTGEIFDVGEQERWRTTTAYRGDRALVTPPAGGTPSMSITDARDRVTEVRQYLGLKPTGQYQATTYSYDHAGRLAGVADPAGNAWSYTYDLRGRQVGSSDPDRGVTTSTFDAAGQLLTTTDARGETLARVYDQLGRQVELRTDSSSGQLRASWVFDTVMKGQLTSATRHHDGAAYVMAVTGYDDGYRPLGDVVTIPPAVAGVAGTYTTTYTYTVDGMLKTLRHPAAGGLPAETVTTYHAAGVSTPEWMSGGFGFGAYVAGSVWPPYGEPLLMDVGPRSATASMINYAYEHGTRRLNKAWLVRPGVSGYDMDVTYGYDPAGNVTEIANEATAVGATADMQCFEYDHLRRLTLAWTPGDGDCADTPSVSGLGGAAPYWLSWTFDAVGNRLTQTRHSGAGEIVDAYTYPAAGQPRPHAPTLVQTSGPGGSSARAYGYDAAGNTTARDHGGVTQSLVWNPEGRVDAVTDGVSADARFVYTADGERLIRREGDVTTLYLPGGHELVHDAGTGVTSARRYYSFAGRTVAVRDDRGLTGGTALISDHHQTAQLAVRRSRDRGTIDVQSRRLRTRTGPTGAVRAVIRRDSSEPESAVAHWFRAIAAGIDPIAVTSKPQSTVDNMAVNDAVFELGVRPRFNPDCLDRDIKAWASKVKQYAPELREEVIEGTIRAHHFNQVSDDVACKEHTSLVRVVCVPALLHETGMFDREIDELFVAAEDLAREQGYQPELAGVVLDRRGEGR